MIILHVFKATPPTWSEPWILRFDMETLSKTLPMSIHSGHLLLKTSGSWS